MAEGHELEMRFDPNTIEHLGVKMYSQIPTAIAELVANSYDASAEHVLITLQDGENKTVTVQDDGDGMTFAEINSCFLLIGRNRRLGGERTTTSGRVVTGKKGLGKLALFGIGDTIEVSTAKDSERVTFKMNWSKLKETADSNYKPTIISRENCGEQKGTTITLSDLKRKSPFDQKALAISLSKLFNFFDETFSVVVKKGDNEIQVNNELKYENLETQFEFPFPVFSAKIDADYEHKDDFHGKIITTEKPLKPGLRGITLFANGRLVNAPEFFGRSESSHFYSYVTGWLDVNFVDDWDEDVISTNRQSLNWDLDKTKVLRDFLQTVLSDVQKEWRRKRKEKKDQDLAAKTNINIPEWYEKLPDDIKPIVEGIVASIDDSQLTTDEQTRAIKKVHQLAPEYPHYHWRHLHDEVRDVSSAYYQNEDYYGAFLEAVKKYTNATRGKSGISHQQEANDYPLMAKAFHKDSGNLCVTTNYTRPNGATFSPQTHTNIQDGQFHLSQGVIVGGRHPVAHEEVNDLRESDLFSEKDCLDMLSLISHLFKRLDNSEMRDQT